MSEKVELIVFFLLSIIHDFQCILHCIRTWSPPPFLSDTGMDRISETESEGEHDNDLEQVMLTAAEYISETESEGENVVEQDNDLGGILAGAHEVQLVGLQLESPLVQWQRSEEVDLTYAHPHSQVESEVSEVLYISETSDEDS